VSSLGRGALPPDWSYFPAYRIQVFVVTGRRQVKAALPSPPPKRATQYPLLRGEVGFLTSVRKPFFRRSRPDSCTAVKPAEEQPFPDPLHVRRLFFLLGTRKRCTLFEKLSRPGPTSLQLWITVCRSPRTASRGDLMEQGGFWCGDGNVIFSSPAKVSVLFYGCVAGYLLAIPPPVFLSTHSSNLARRSRPFSY